MARKTVTWCIATSADGVIEMSRHAGHYGWAEIEDLQTSSFHDAHGRDGRWVR
jgi:hypothetical protein